MKHIQVAAAVIIRDDKILCVQRGQHKLQYISHKWEFPGGKIEIGESPMEALQRELREELHADITEPSHLIIVEHEYPDFHITMHCFTCELKNNDYQLTEHVNAVWLSSEELPTLDWAAADIPVVEALQNE